MIKKILITLIICIFGFTAFAEDSAEKWWGTTVPSAFMLYIVNPDKLAGWPAKLYDYEAAYFPEKYVNLPVLGSWHEGGGIPDKEMLLKHNVKKAFFITSSVHTEEKYPELKRFGMEVFTLKGGTLAENITLLRELSKKLGVPERGEKLAAYGEGALAEMSALSEKIGDRPRVYIADRNDGLTTSCANEVLELVGGENAFSCDNSITRGFTRINFEQIVMIDPDVIVVTNPFFAENLKNDTKWHRLRAYRENKVFIVPYGPFGWMDKPAVMKFIALKWLANKLHPEHYSIDMQEETKQFMRLFLHLDLDDEEIKTILYR